MIFKCPFRKRTIIDMKHTNCVHAGTMHDENTGGVNTPIYTSTSFEYLDRSRVYYPRYSNIPNQFAVIKKMCALENKESGLLFSSGMAAISAAVLSRVKAGDHALFPASMYGGTTSFIKNVFGDYSLEYDFLDSMDVDSLSKSIKPNTKVIYIETPSNPLLDITDIESVAEFAKSKGITTIIDNTFATPINQNPGDFGVDIVVHSATKYLGGHSDICAGVVLGSRMDIKKIKRLSLNFGGSLNAEASYLLERSIKTLAIRMEKINQNAMNVAAFLNGNCKIGKVYYPGLPSHSGYEIAKKQMTGFGGVVSFELGNQDPIEFQKKLKIIKPSVSLGAVESIICSPALTSHYYMPKEQREKIGVTDKLLRLSVGIEDSADLIEDLKQAMCNCNCGD